MDKLDQYLKLWEKDAVMDKSDLVSESLKIPYLHGEWYKRYLNEKKTYNSWKEGRSRIIGLLYQYYSGDILESELNELGREPLYKSYSTSEKIKRMVESDKQLVKLNMKIENQKDVVDFLKSAIDSINGRSYHINNAINFMKFEHGG